MYHVETTRITHVADGTSDYAFPCLQPADFSTAAGYEYFDALGGQDFGSELQALSEVRREERMWQLYEAHIIPRIESGRTLYLNGTFTKRIYDHVRDLYRELGAYDATENRYRIPAEAPITLGVDIVNLVYRSERKPSIYLSQ